MFFGAREGVRQRPMRLVLRLAAGIVVLLAAGAIAYFAFLKGSSEPGAPARAAALDTGSRKGNAQAQPAAPTFAANFTPSPNMEDLVGADFRAVSVSVASPANGQVISGEDLFRWETRSSMTFKVRVLTNRETEVFQATTRNDSVLCNKRLDPGLYYWTLQEDGELVHVGKFTIPVR